MTSYADLSAELCAVDVDEHEHLRAEITTLLHFGGGLTESNRVLRLRSEPVSAGGSERLSKLIRRFSGVQAPVYLTSETSRPCVSVESRYVRRLAYQLGLLSPSGFPIVGLPPRLVSDGARDPLLATAALRGAVLASGRVKSNKHGGMALAIDCPGFPAAVALRAMARHIGAGGELREDTGGRTALVLRPRWGLREALIALGAITFAGEHLGVESERRRAEHWRGIGGKSNRASAQRAALEASEKVRSAMELLGDDIPLELAEVAAARLAHPEESLTEIGDRCGISKNAVCGRLRRIRQLAESAEMERVRRPA